MDAPCSGDEIRLYVCVTCRQAGGGDADLRPGAQLHEALSAALAQGDPALGGVRIEPVECLSVCKRPCTMAIAGGEGRWTYVYGDLDPQTSVEAIVDGLRRYRATANGIVPWRERPEIFRKGVVARIPPLSPIG